MDAEKHQAPAFSSLVFDEMPAPDWADVVLVPLPSGATTDPRQWAEAVFDVRRVVGEEALIRADDEHLDFAVGVGVDAQGSMVGVTTAVRLHGWRGRLYFAPVSLLHDPVTRAMMRSAARRLAGEWAH